MKKVLLCSAIALSVLAGCGDGKYSEVRDLLDDIASAQEAFIDKSGRVSSAKQLAKMLNAFADEMNGIKLRIDELDKKFPELRNVEGIPPEIREEIQILRENGLKVNRIREKCVEAFIQSPDVQRTAERLTKIMQELR